VTGTVARIVFENGVAISASNGQFEVDWGESNLPEQDRSWLINGWGQILPALQAGDLVLHASSVAVNSSGCLVVGSSGAGKSTTIVALAQAGHRPLTDEVGVMAGPTLDNPSLAAELRPFPRAINLTEQTLDFLNLDADAWLQLQSNPAKGMIPGPEVLPKLYPIQLIFELRLSGVVIGVESRKLSRLEAMAVAIEHSNYQGFSTALLGQKRYMGLLTALVEKIPIVRISRPENEDSLDAVLAAIETAVEDHRALTTDGFMRS
jgi:energy-coupling factor transporter ATP-binding protein EcfA2